MSTLVRGGGVSIADHVVIDYQTKGRPQSSYGVLERIRELEEELRKKNEQIKQLEDEVFELTVLVDKKGKSNG